jgi:uncharacterized RDD family membrane protein YckC
MNENEQGIETNDQPIVIAGFWRRLFAFLIDSTLLGIVGIVIGWVLFDFFVRLGGWGLVIGFVIALLYFALMNSNVSHGQTIGKRLMKIKVFDSSGSPLSISKSSLRFAVIGIPFFLNGAPIPAEVLLSWFGFIISLAVFGLGLSIVYLYLFNKRTRQSLHDLIIGSYVLNADAKSTDIKAATWKGHYIIVAMLLIAASLIPLFAGHLAEREPFKDLLTVQQAIQNEPAVGYATAQVGNTQSGKTVTTFISSRITVEKEIVDYNSMANKIASIILEKYPAAAEKNYISLTVSYGFDIGIAHMWSNRNFVFSPSQWKERINSQFKSET